MYIAKKPCHFGDKTYFIGESIPEDIIGNSRVSALVKWGMISEVDGEVAKAASPVTDGKKGEVEEAVQNAPESTGKAEIDESATTTEKSVKTGRKGGRKKAEA